ncbi:hypothetical protein ACWGB8_01080 [Kitasatospora sp. NPDC054939]
MDEPQAGLVPLRPLRGGVEVFVRPEELAPAGTATRLRAGMQQLRAAQRVRRAGA